MKWKKYSFKTDSNSVDILSALLSDEGIEGIEIEDHKPLSEEDTKGMFIDILPDLGVDDGTAIISFYLDPDDPELETKLEGAKRVIREAKAYANISGDGETSDDARKLSAGREDFGVIIESETEDVDWINNWKKFFKPLTVGDILIQPSWEEVSLEDRSKLLIQIDPGTAFGTGGHETTQLCILALEKYIKALRKEKTHRIEVLDVGTGSGILGIAALKLGAHHVFGTDLDDNAIEAVKENMNANAIMPDEFTIACGNVIDNRGIQFAAGFNKYDIVVANILAPVIIELQKEITQHMKPGAIFITSGIIDTKEQAVREAMEANPELEIVGVEHLGEWVSVVARKKAYD